MTKWVRFDLRSFAVILLSLLLLLPNAGAWNSIGHMTVAYVAYDQLTPQKQARVIELLALNPNFNVWKSYIKAGTDPALQNRLLFAMAATWPDEIRAIPSYKLDGDRPPNTPEATANIGYTDMTQHDYWHFVDMPFSTDGTKLPVIPTPNAMTQIKALRAALASDEPDALKSYDLVWLIHLTGDVHQPTHCTERVTKDAPRGDAGGNGVALTGKAPNYNLHSYWDELLGVGYTKDYAMAVQASATLPTPDASAVADLNEQDWVNESFQMAQKDAYVLPIGPLTKPSTPYTIAPGSAYATQALSDVQKRVALAGARLAGVLNAELK